VIWFWIFVGLVWGTVAIVVDESIKWVKRRWKGGRAQYMGGDE